MDCELLSVEAKKESGKFSEIWDISERAMWGRLGLGEEMGNYFDEVILKSLRKRLQEKDLYHLRVDPLSRIVSIGLVLFYTTARLFLIGIMFSSMRSVPEGVYNVIPWTTILPSIS